MKIFTAPIVEYARVHVCTYAGKSRRMHTSIPAYQHTSPGFTLIEALLAIAIMSIVAGIGIPATYGAYQNQQMLNTANEIIAGVQVARAKALANYQGIYATTPPQPDCTSSKPYVDLYSFAVGADNKSYTVTPGLRATNSSNVGCSNSPAPSAIYSRPIPNPITVASTNGGTVALPITFKTTSGQSNLGPTGVAQIDLLANGILGNRHLYVCIKQSSMYVQNNAC